MGFLFFDLVEVSELNGNGKRLYIHSYILYIHQPADHCYGNKISNSYYYYILLHTTTYYYEKSYYDNYNYYTTPPPPHTHQPTDSTPQEDKGIKEESSQRKSLSCPRSLIPIPASAFPTSP